MYVQVAACAAAANTVLADSQTLSGALTQPVPAPGALSHLQLHHERLELVLPLRLAGGKDIPRGSCARLTRDRQDACGGWAQVCWMRITPQSHRVVTKVVPCMTAQHMCKDAAAR